MMEQGEGKKEERRQLRRIPLSSAVQKETGEEIKEETEYREQNMDC